MKKLVYIISVCFLSFVISCQQSNETKPVLQEKAVNFSSNPANDIVVKSIGLTQEIIVTQLDLQERVNSLKDYDLTNVDTKELEKLLNNSDSLASVLIADLEDAKIPDVTSYIGFGKNTTGGKGHQIVFVTNLNNSGTGSLRSALSSGNRIVKFNVGGTITLSDNIKVLSNTTIDGSEAPGEGITIKNFGLQLRSSNVVVEYLRVDVTNSPSSSTDAIQIRGYSGTNVENIVVNHVSLRGGRDGNFDINTTGNGTVKNVSFINSITADNTKNLLVRDNVSNVSIINNAMSGSAERHIRGLSSQPDLFTFELINNYMYDFKYGTQVNLGVKFSSINNVYRTSRALGKGIEGVANDNTSIDNKTHAYVSGNQYLGLGEFNSRIQTYLKNEPFASSGYIPVPASEIDLSTVGCSLPKRDQKDKDLINEIEN